MADLFEFIAQNFVLIIIIVGGILKVLKESSSSKQKEETTGRQQRPANPSRPRPVSPVPTQAQRVPTKPVKQEQKQTVQTVSIEEQQQQQLERLAGSMRTTVDLPMSEIGDIQDNSLESGIEHSAILLERKHNQANDYHHEKFKSQMKNQLNRNGLIEGIIMAEILGPPRAQKPYRPVTEERKR
ncbi:hypothetical protein ACFFIS_02860 [Virgibacillus soli]